MNRPQVRQASRCAAVAVAVLAATATAQAEDAPRPAKRHGLYARAAVGPGLFAAWSGSDVDTRRFIGGTVSGELRLGGGLAPALVFGGAFLTDQVFALSSEDEVIDGDEPTLEDVSFSLNSLGPFFSVFPSQELPIEIQAYLGFATLGTGRADTADPTGLLVSGSVGYAWRVAEKIHIGALVRLTFPMLGVREISLGSERSVSGFVPALLFTATYY